MSYLRIMRSPLLNTLIRIYLSVRVRTGFDLERLINLLMKPYYDEMNLKWLVDELWQSNVIVGSDTLEKLKGIMKMHSFIKNQEKGSKKTVITNILAKQVITGEKSLDEALLQLSHKSKSTIQRFKKKCKK